jgi:GNAT superfamily N-acetyltransferase
MFGTQQDGLATGSQEFVLIPAGPADACRISDFVAALSLRTQFFRFFASVTTPSSSLLRSLCGDGSPEGRDVLIALDRGGAVIGHGMAVDKTTSLGEITSDIGLVVADAWQGRGVGTVLLGALIQRAARRGSAELVMDVLPENGQMLAIIDRHWPGAPRYRNRDSWTIRARLGAPAQASPAAG